MKKTLLWIPLLIMLVAMAGSIDLAKGQTPAIEIEPSSVEVMPGDSFIISIKIDGVTDLYLWMVRLKWNNTLLELNSLPVEGPFLKQGGATSGLMFDLTTDNVMEMNSEGKIVEMADTLMGAGIPGVDGSGTLATLNFTAVAMGTTLIEFWEDEAHQLETDLWDRNGDSISHTATPGTVHVIPEYQGPVLIALFLLMTLFVVILGKKHT